MDYKIIRDEWTEHNNPRQWDNLGTMVCWHRNYILGDEQPTWTLGEYLSGMLDDYGVERLDRNGFYTQQWEDFIYDLENDDPDSIRKAWDLLDDKIFVLPLYLYDHSGLTINTSGFHCPWDAGQVGFIYVTRDDVLKEYGRKHLSAKLIDKVKSVLRSEVEVYDQYLRGDVWGYVIKDRHGEHIDSCWGYFGYEYCEQEAINQLECFQKEENKELIALQSEVR